MSNEVVVAFFGFLGILTTAVFGYLKTRKTKQERNQAKAELEFQSSALSFHDFLGEWSEIHQELKSLVESTEIDRFLIFRAWNGSITPKWTTAIYQYRQGHQEPFSYVHFEIDNDYVERLRLITSAGSMVLNIAQLPKSIIKDVYEAEEVTHSAWFFLSRSELKSNPDCCAISYCSFATHKKEPLSSETITRCRILVSRLKALASK